MRDRLGPRDERRACGRSTAHGCEPCCATDTAHGRCPAPTASRSTSAAPSARARSAHRRAALPVHASCASRAASRAGKHSSIRTGLDDGSRLSEHRGGSSRSPAAEAESACGAARRPESTGPPPRPARYPPLGEREGLLDPRLTEPRTQRPAERAARLLDPVGSGDLRSLRRQCRCSSAVRGLRRSASDTPAPPRPMSTTPRESSELHPPRTTGRTRRTRRRRSNPSRPSSRRRPHGEPGSSSSAARRAAARCDPTSPHGTPRLRERQARLDRAKAVRQRPLIEPAQPLHRSDRLNRLVVPADDPKQPRPDQKQPRVSTEHGVGEPRQPGQNRGEPVDVFTYRIQTVATSSRPRRTLPPRARGGSPPRPSRDRDARRRPAGEAPSPFQARAARAPSRSSSANR